MIAGVPAPCFNVGSMNTLLGGESSEFSIQAGNDAAFQSKLTTLVSQRATLLTWRDKFRDRALHNFSFDLSNATLSRRVNRRSETTMSTRREQLIGAALFLVLVLLGWSPFYLEAVRAEVYDAVRFCWVDFLRFLRRALLGRHAGERLFGAGKGIYVAAVLTSLAAAAIVFSEPPLLSSTSLMFISAATLWFAARGNKRERA